jgi:F-type H+-transporting ATPase subunit b
MEILNEFGFNAGLFFAQIVNFLILAFVFKKFLYKPLLKVLNDRKNTIEKGIKDSEEAAKALATAEEEKSLILHKASKESQKIIDDTKKSAETLKEEILNSARSEAEKVMTEAKKQSELEMDKMRKEAQNMSLQLSKTILEKVITQMFSKDEQVKLIKKGLQEIEKNG